MTRRHGRILLPSHEPTQGALPIAVPVLSLVGLAVLCFCTIPAVLEHHRLQGRLQASQTAAQLAQQELQQRRTQLRAGPRDAFSRIRRLRELRSQGQRYLSERRVYTAPPQPAPRAARGTPVRTSQPEAPAHQGRVDGTNR